MNVFDFLSGIIIGISIIIAGFMINRTIAGYSTSQIELTKESVRNEAIDGCYQAGRVQYTSPEGNVFEVTEDSIFKSCLADKNIQ